VVVWDEREFAPKPPLCNEESQGYRNPILSAML
jgi:hypothetical protein